jgi:hypothetical protein
MSNAMKVVTEKIKDEDPITRKQLREAAAEKHAQHLLNSNQAFYPIGPDGVRDLPYDG